MIKLSKNWVVKFISMQGKLFTYVGQTKLKCFFFIVQTVVDGLSFLISIFHSFKQLISFAQCNRCSCWKTLKKFSFPVFQWKWNFHSRNNYTIWSCFINKYFNMGNWICVIMLMLLFCFLLYFSLSALSFPWYNNIEMEAKNLTAKSYFLLMKK